MKFASTNSSPRSKLWFLAGTFALVVGVLLLVTPALAQLVNNGGLNELQGNVALGNKPLIQTIGSIINIFLGFLGVIAVALILYAGFLWMTARGNEEQLGKAKRILSSAAIGLAIILVSFALASYILDKLGGATNPPGPVTCWDGSQVLPPDTCPPQGFGGSQSRDFVVNGHNPTTDQTGVKLCSVVSAAFNRDVAPASVSNSTFYIFQGATPFSATALTPNANTATFEHSGPGHDFAPSTTYTATLTTGLYDTTTPTPIHLKSNVSWSFTTGTETDNLPPTVELVPPPDPPAAPATKNVNPRDGATNVCRRTSIQMKFTEVMNPATMLLANVTLLDVTTNTPVLLKNIAIGGDLSSFTAYPVDKLAPNHDFKVTVQNMADACNNVMAPAFWTFHTNDVENCNPELTKVYLTSDSSKTQGYYGDGVTLEGKNLGISVNRALFNGFDTPSASIASWADTAIKLNLPSGAPIPPNPQNVWVQMVAGPASNQLQFTLLSPYLRSLSPNKGAVGQFVTLKGLSFGAAKGTVKFSTTDATFPCADTSWTDKQVIVQVPVGLPLGIAHVTLYTVGADGTAGNADDKPSNIVDFTVNTDPLSPGLCEVHPTCSQSGKDPVLTSLVGKHFGGTKGKVFMSNQAAANNGAMTMSWDNENIGNVIFNATFQDAAHDVQVEAAGRRSNALDFGIPCTGGPQVVESQMCAVASQSPSPYLNQADACSNAAVSARFTAAMDEATFTHSLPGANIEVRPCTDATCTAFGAPLTFASYKSVPGFGGVAGFILNKPTPAFMAGGWYQATISQAVKGLDGRNLRSDYQWHWQVSGTACTVDTIKVQNDPTYIRKIDLPPPDGVAGPDPGSTAGFTAQPTAANCNTLDPTSYTWKPWVMSGNLNGPNPWVSKLSDSDNQAVAIANDYMPGPTPATITASLDTPAKSGSAKVYVSATACTASLDCVVPACSLGVSSCVHNACTPAVTSFDPAPPDGGAPGTWVTINGCFFGRSLGTVTYQVGQVGLAPNSAYCPDGTWTDERIVSEVPPGAQDGTFTVHRNNPAADAVSPSGFDVNTTVRPGLCSISRGAVYESQLGTDQAQVILRGRQFGDSQGTGLVKFYDKDTNDPPVYTATGSASTYGSWSDITIDKAVAPAGAGMTSTKAIGVTQGGVESNKFSFAVKPGSPPNAGQPPVITSISPDNGMAQTAATTIVTITGSNLTGGTAYFGTVPAPVSGCLSTPNVLTVEAPAGLTPGTCSSSTCSNDSTRSCTANSDCAAVSVRVKNDAGSSGALDFTPNNIIRPGICSISPSFGQAGSQITITGRNFTDNRQPTVSGSFVSMACNPADGNVNCFSSLNVGQLSPADPAANTNRYKLASLVQVTSWSNRRIVAVAPPKVRSGEVRVTVDYGGGDARGSNAVTFMGEPYITSMTPATGPESAWVTIRGGNFGKLTDCPAGARGVSVTDACVVTFAGAGTARVLEAPLPALCSNDSWTDSEIIAKVPPGVVNDTGLGTGNKLVKVRTPNWPAPIGTLETKAAASQAFTLDNTLPVGPGLCALNPASIANLSTLVTLSGDGFGSSQGANDKVLWPASTSPAVSSWGNDTITVPTSAEKLPADTNSGEVAVQREVAVVTGRTCSGLQLGSTCLGLWQPVTSPRLLKSNPKQLKVNFLPAGPAAAPRLDSVKPADASTGVCTNAVMVAKFKTPINPSLVSLSQFTLAPAALGTLQVVGSSLTFLPDQALAASTTYTVTISSPQVADSTGTPCAASTHCTWTFKTGVQACAIGSVTITPSQYKFTDTATAQAFVAQALSVDSPPQPLSASYAWQATDTNKVLNLASNTGSSVSVRAAGVNGQASLTVTADASTAFGVWLDPAGVCSGGLTPGKLCLALSECGSGTCQNVSCPAGSVWQDRNSNGTKDVAECLKQYRASATANVEAYLCQVPWTLQDDDYHFRLRYCRADTVKVAGDPLAQLANGSFTTDADNNSLPDGWTTQGAVGWQIAVTPQPPGPSTAGDLKSVQATHIARDIDVVAGNYTLTQQISGLQQHTLYLASALAYVPNNSPTTTATMILTSDPTCRSDPAYAQTLSAAVGWQKLQVLFDSGARTDYTICLYANGSSQPALYQPLYFDQIEVHGVAPGSLLPELSAPSPTPGPGDLDIVREYFLKNPSSPDAIALRIYKNDQRLSPRAWYDSRTDIIKGSPQSFTIDGYEAVKDGNTVYVSALNEDSDQNASCSTAAGVNICSNIYVLTYNRGAASDTQKIAQALTNDWTFSVNSVGRVDTAGKRALQRDFRRLNDRASMRASLAAYAASHSQTLPTLAAGSYVKGLSVSRWDSWQQNLGSPLKVTLPVDPVNGFCNGTTPTCPASATQCLVPKFNQQTCWNAVDKKFECPTGSHVYQYQAQGSTKAHIYLNLERKNVTWQGGDVVTVHGNADPNYDKCDSMDLLIDVGSPPLTVLKAGGGSGTVKSDVPGIDCGSDCSENYAGGATVKLTANYDPASAVFTGWGGDCTGTNTTCSLSMTINRTVRANFAAVATLTVSPPTHGTVTAAPNINCPPAATCSHTYAQGTTVTLTALPAAGYVLSSWGGACSGTSSTCPVNLASSRTVTVTFMAASLLTVATLGGGSGSVTSNPAGLACPGSCSTLLPVGNPVTLTATPAAGSVFVSWSGPPATCNGSTSRTCTYTPTSTTPLSLTARFELGVEVAVTLAGAGGGSVTLAPAPLVGPATCSSGTCTATYSSGTNVSLTAVAEADSTFTSWSGDCSANPCPFTNLSAPKAATATFGATNYSFTVTKPSGGTVSSTPSGLNCGDTGTSCVKNFGGGATITLIATASNGFLFTGWGGACAGNSPSCQVTMDAVKSVTASFMASGNAVTITITKPGGGGGTVKSTPPGLDCGSLACSASYSFGTTLALSAVADAQSIFTGWSGGGCNGLAACNPTLNSATTVSARFVPQVTLTVAPDSAATGVGTITSNPGTINCGATCSATYASGSSVTLTAVPAAGSVFVGWSANCVVVTQNTCTTSLTADTTVSYTFKSGFALTVTPAGTGTGTVTSNPAGINCGATCSWPYAAGTSVTLTAVPAAGSAFTGWSGSGCSGTGTCPVAMSAARAVTATFMPAYLLTVSKNGSNGSGTVATADLAINCGSACNALYAEGSSVTLTATPVAGSGFMAASSTCPGSSWTVSAGVGSCTVTISAATGVNAVFNIVTHSVTVTPVGAGSGTVTSTPGGINCSWNGSVQTGTCTTQFPDGSSIALTATAAPGSMPVGLSGDCTGLASCNLTVNANKSVTASFAVARTLNVTVAGTGSGSVTSSPAGINCSAGTCSKSYVSGTTVVITATAQAGSVFKTWDATGDCKSFATNPTCTLSLTANRSATATFDVAPTHTLSVTPSSSGVVTGGGLNCGSGKAQCTASYPVGASVTLSAAAEAGYVFSGWNGVGGCTGNGTCTVTMNSDISGLQANFTDQAAAHNIHVDLVGIGSVVSDPVGLNCGVQCDASMADQTVMKLTAAGQAGYAFTGWSGDVCAGSSNPICPFTLTQNTNVTATFTVAAAVDLTVVNASGHGTVTSAPAGIACGAQCQAAYTSTTQVTLYATAEAGYIFAGWSAGTKDATVCNNSSATTCTIPTLTNASQVTATFVLTHNLAVTKAGTGAATGTVTSTPMGIVCGTTCSATLGGTVTLTASPNGKVFTGWSAGTGSATACNGSSSVTCTFALTADSSITATFVNPAYLLIANVSPVSSGTITASPLGDCGADCYSLGQTLSLTAVPVLGYQFSFWSGDAATCATMNPCSITMNANKNVTANFVVSSTFQVTVNVYGSGTVSSNPAGISNCANTCTGTFASGTVALTATPGAGYAFIGWDGDAAVCATTNPCSLNVNANKSVVASFVSNTSSASVLILASGEPVPNDFEAGSGGTVRSSNGLINCLISKDAAGAVTKSGSCSPSVPLGSVKLTFTPSVGSKFKKTYSSPTVCNISAPTTSCYFTLPSAGLLQFVAWGKQ